VGALLAGASCASASAHQMTDAPTAHNVAAKPLLIEIIETPPYND
jgi:hypothetical protein